MGIPFEPLEGYCLCLAPGIEQTEGGIVVPRRDIGDGDEERPEPMKLTVVMVGPGEQMDHGLRREVVVEEGSTYYFMFPRYSMGSYLKLGGVDYVIIQSKYVCGKAREL